MSYLTIKRSFDLACSGIGLLLLLPVALIIALLIKLTDRGPVFFGQTRVGQHGQPFRMWKFRSMVVNADKLGVPLTKEEDPRITWIGRFLRKAKLDELPQLWNVLAGDMSFVGPRPEMQRYVAHYTTEQRQILSLKPGITDVATMLFRNEEALLRGTGDVEKFYLQYCLPKKIELNLQYARRANFLRDIWIIVQTLCPYWLGVLIIYAIALTTSFGLAYELRSDFNANRQDYEEFRRYLPWIIFPQLILLFWGGQLRGLISYFSIPELRRTAVALLIAFCIQFGLCNFSQGRLEPNRSLLLIDLFLSFCALCSVRMAFRFLREHSADEKPVNTIAVRRVAIIGTGELATNLALDFARGKNSRRRVIAFFDDDPHTWHKRPHDIPVIGMPECLLNTEWESRIDEVILALPEGDLGRVREIHEMLKARPVKITDASGWPALKPLEI
jgi:lipopolysaccharide/colanic/teichoic acid biosynthesis glycosyltransferase